MTIKHIALVFPSHLYCTRDVAVGYESAFKRLGLAVHSIHYEHRCKFWTKAWHMMHGEDAEMSKDNIRQCYERASGDVLFQLMKFQPDVAVIIDGSELHEIFWEYVRKLNIPTAVIMTENPYRDWMNSFVVEQADFSFANDQISAQQMNIHYLPTAYDPNVHHPMIVPTEYQSDVCFVGSGFPERVAILEGVDWRGIDFRLLGHFVLPEGHPLLDFYKQDEIALPNPEAALYYCGAKLVLNLDRTSIDFPAGRQQIAKRLSCGPRVYEVAACGTTLVSQNVVAEIDEMIPNAYVQFTDSADLSEKLHTWLRPDMAKAREGYARKARKLIEPHSYLNRAQQLLDVIQ